MVHEVAAEARKSLIKTTRELEEDSDCSRLRVLGWPGLLAWGVKRHGEIDLIRTCQPIRVCGVKLDTAYCWALGVETGRGRSRPVGVCLDQRRSRSRVTRGTSQRWCGLSSGSLRFVGGVARSTKA